MVRLFTDIDRMIRRFWTLRTMTVVPQIYIVVCLNDERSYRAKKGVHGGEIRYQIRIQRAVERIGTLTRKL